ncbi:MAG TPA: hypothetical protein VJO33_09210 [Gemmatimonadaceae bacterium]|nr:hypothetical protein [Gemmatimonadaceae bacterium]
MSASSLRSTTIKLAPFNFFKITVGLYRIVPGPPLDPGMQGELLKELHRDYPSLTQIQGGVLFSDPPKGRTLIIDQARVESTETSPRSATQAIERIGDEFQKTLRIVAYPAPYRVKVEADGTIAAWEGLDPVSVLKRHAPPRPEWDALGGVCRFACVRYLFATPDGGQRDVRIEPLFQAPDRFYTSAISMPGSAASETLGDAMERARQEADTIERLSNRLVADIAGES